MKYSGNVVVNLKKMIEFFKIPRYLFIIRYGSKVRVGEGRFITFYFIIFYTISFFIYKKNTKVINLPSPTLTFDPSLAHRLTCFSTVLN